MNKPFSKKALPKIELDLNEVNDVLDIVEYVTTYRYLKKQPLEKQMKTLKKLTIFAWIEADKELKRGSKKLEAKK